MLIFSDSVEPFTHNPEDSRLDPCFDVLSPLEVSNSLKALQLPSHVMPLVSQATSGLQAWAHLEPHLRKQKPWLRFHAWHALDWCRVLWLQILLLTKPISPKRSFGSSQPEFPARFFGASSRICWSVELPDFFQMSLGQYFTLEYSSISHDTDSIGSDWSIVSSRIFPAKKNDVSHPNLW